MFRKGRFGFTLIELMIVVVIMAVISGIALPWFLRARDEARERRGSEDGFPATPTERVRPAHPEELPKGTMPTIESAKLNLSLSTSYHRIGMNVYTRFALTSQGQVTFSKPAGEPEQKVLLFIPFPAETMEGRDVKLSIADAATNNPFSPTDLLYHRSGIFAVCSMTSGQRLNAAFGYTAFGRERLVLSLPPSRQLQEISANLNISGADSWIVPDESLQPTSTTPGELKWEFRNLVSDRKIVVEIPGAQGPMAKVLLLLRLIAIAVLLFGAGFWYLSEQYKPGLLDHFRLGHFFLQALTYSLFFAIFTLFEFHSTFSTAVSMVISGAASLPLLVLVVKPILGVGFAVTRVVPLAVFTLGLVINGVYGGDARDYIFILSAIFIVTYVTTTYESWSKGREVYRNACDEEYEKGRKNLIQRANIELGREMNKLYKAEAMAKIFKDRYRMPEMEPVVSQLSKACEMVPHLGKDYDSICRRANSMPVRLSWEENDVTADVTGEINCLLTEVSPTLEKLENSLQTVSSAAETLIVKHGGNETHCMACGSPGPRTKFCAGCGAAHVADSVCPNCQTSLAIPLHLIPPEKTQNKLFCRKCGAILPMP